MNDSAQQQQQQQQHIPARTRDNNMYAGMITTVAAAHTCTHA